MRLGSVSGVGGGGMSDYPYGMGPLKEIMGNKE